MRKFILFAIVLTFVFCLIPFDAFAQEFNVTLFPAKLEITGEPGSVHDFEINLHNHGREEQHMWVYFNDYYIRPDNRFVFASPGHYSYSCSRWLQMLEGPDMTVPAGTIGKKRFRAVIPKNAEPGGHYGVIFFERLPLPGKPPVTATPRLGAIIMITVPGQIVREGRIKSVSVKSSFFWPTRKFPFLPRSNLDVRVVFENVGNVHLTIRGKLIFKPSFGWGSGVVDLGEITVLPKTIRYLDATIGEEKKNPSNTSKAKKNKEKINPPLVGSYRVKVEIEYGPSLDVFDTKKTATASFSVYPFSAFVLIVALIAILYAVLWIFRRKKVESAGEVEKSEEKEAEISLEVGPAVARKKFLSFGRRKASEPEVDLMKGEEDEEGKAEEGDKSELAKGDEGGDYKEQEKGDTKVSKGESIRKRILSVLKRFRGRQKL